MALSLATRDSKPSLTRAVFSLIPVNSAARASHRNTLQLVEGLAALDGVQRAFDRPFFHEAVLRLDAPVKDVLRAMAAQNVLAGYSLQDDYPALENCLLVCATEKRTQQDVAGYVGHMERILTKLKAPACPVQPKI